MARPGVWLKGGKNLFFIFFIYSFLFINVRAYQGRVTGVLGGRGMAGVWLKGSKKFSFNFFSFYLVIFLCAGDTAAWRLQKNFQKFQNNSKIFNFFFFFFQYQVGFRKTAPTDFA